MTSCGFPERLHTGLASPQLASLDGLRAVAAFLVVFYHFGIQVSPGGLGVLAFFVLSGFLITWLLLAEQQRFGTVSLRAFYARRVLRLFPAFYVYWFLATVTVLALGKRFVFGEALAAFFYVHNYYQAFQDTPATAFSHTWSLGVEEQFYLLWPVLFLLLGLRHNLRHMAVGLAVIVFAVWVWRTVLVFGVGVPQRYVYSAFDTRADHLLIGCLLAVALRARFVPRFWRVLCTSPVMSLLTVSLTIITCVAEYRLGTTFRNTVSFLVHPLLIAVLIPQLISFRATMMWSWLNWRPVRYLGRISYSIYLYQQIAMEPPKQLLATYPWALRLAVSVAVVVGVASASHWLIEKPFLRLKDRYRGRASPPWKTLLKTGFRALRDRHVPPGHQQDAVKTLVTVRTDTGSGIRPGTDP